MTVPRLVEALEEARDLCNELDSIAISLNMDHGAKYYVDKLQQVQNVGGLLAGLPCEAGRVVGPKIVKLASQAADPDFTRNSIQTWIDLCKRWAWIALTSARRAKEVV